MRKFVDCLGNKVAGNKTLYYILNFTWGLPMTILGLLLTLIFLPFGRIKRYNYIYYIELRRNTGWGFSIGTMFVCGKNGSYDIHLLQHEFGHGVQNAIFGPLTLFFIYLPSAIRFWWRDAQWKKYKKHPENGSCNLHEYDDIWFEGSATDIGNAFYKRTHEFIKKWNGSEWEDMVLVGKVK